MKQKSITLPAPAKVNLYLTVLGRRPDGYHEVETVMQKIDLADLISITTVAQKGIALQCLGGNLPEDGANLVYKAATLFFEHTAINFGVEIVLKKKIPVAAGLGGGSSDAAATLLGLNRLFETGISQEALIELSRPLGADVPFFVMQGGAAFASGIGNDLRPIASKSSCSIVLVNPGISVSTKWVYDNLALTTESNPYMFVGCSKSTSCGCASRVNSISSADEIVTLYNDLESVTLHHYPVLKDIKDDFEQGGATATLMSGSGPTVFGIFDQPDIALKNAERFKGQFDQVYLTSPLPQK